MPKDTHYPALFISFTALMFVLGAIAFMGAYTGGAPARSTAALGDFLPGAGDASGQVGAAAGVDMERELLNEILELRSITLDTGLFEDPLFTSLVDFSQEITPQSVGRLDPFAPVPE